MVARPFCLALLLLPIGCGGSSVTPNPTTVGTHPTPNTGNTSVGTSVTPNSTTADTSPNTANPGGNAAASQEPFAVNTTGGAPGIPAGPCVATAPNTWAAAAKGGPAFPDVADPIGVWLNEQWLFVWDAYLPIRQARLYDASCNQWLNVPLPSSVPAEFTFDRRYGVSASNGKLIVYGPTWEPNTGSQVPPGPFRVLLLDAQRRAWIDASPPPKMAGREAHPSVGEGKLVLWEGARTTVFDMDTAKWRQAATPAPFGNVEPGCSRVSAHAWDVWTDGAHQRLDLDKLVWTRQAIPTARFQRCFVHSLGPDEDLVASPPIKAPGIPAGMIFHRQTLAHTEVTGTGLDGAWLLAAGGDIWTQGGPDSAFYHYNRSSKQWSPVVMPPSSLPGKSPASYSIHALGNVAVLRKVDPPMGAVAPGMAPPTSAKVEAWVFRNGSFGQTITLGTFDEGCSRIQDDLGLLCKRSGNTVEWIDPTTQRAIRQFASPPKSGYLQRYSKSFALHWGVTETVTGNDCDNPFHPQKRLPNRPICTPSHSVTYSRAGEGGSVMRFGP